MTYTELYPFLLQKGLLVPRPLGSPPDPFPLWYNPNAYCSFHEGAPGIDLEGCYVLKYIVRELVEKKILSLRDLGHKVKSNPLSVHGTVNAVEETYDGDAIKDVANIKTPLPGFHARLLETGLVSDFHKDCEEYAIHPRVCEMV